MFSAFWSLFLGTGLVDYWYVDAASLAWNTIEFVSSDYPGLIVRTSKSDNHEFFLQLLLLNYGSLSIRLLVYSNALYLRRSVVFLLEH